MAAKGRQVGRDAITGQFVPVSVTKIRPSTTIVQTIKPVKKGK